MPSSLKFPSTKRKKWWTFCKIIFQTGLELPSKLRPKSNPKWKTSRNVGKKIWRTQRQVALAVQGQVALQLVVKMQRLVLQGRVALMVEMALRAYPTVHWLSGRLNSGFECIKRFSPQQTHTQLNCLRNTHFFNASLQKLFKTNWTLLYLDNWSMCSSQITVWT